MTLAEDIEAEAQRRIEEAKRRQEEAEQNARMIEEQARRAREEAEERQREEAKRKADEAAKAVIDAYNRRNAEYMWDLFWNKGGDVVTRTGIEPVKFSNTAALVVFGLVGYVALQKAGYI